MSAVAVAALAAPALHAGFGIYNAIQGNNARKEGEAAKLDARESIANTKYADFNQAYYDELQRRQGVGLQQEQLTSMQQGADRAVGAGLAVSEDRRGGLMGVGRAASSLADAYMNIGLADVAQREQNAQAVLAEMSNRGTSNYNEAQNLNMYDLSEAEKMRMEGLSQQQAGFQNILGGVSAAAPIIGGMAGGSSMFGAGTPSMATPSAPSTMANPFTSYQPPQNLSLANNNSPFAYGSGLNYTQGMSGVNIGQ